MMERIKKINRALLELELGIVFLSVIGQLIGLLFYRNVVMDAVSLLIGSVLAALMGYHMYRVLDVALDLGDKAPAKIVTGSMLRYGVLIIVFLIEVWSGELNPVITFIGVMFLKVAGYIQPFTHRFCNYIFHETDPVAQPLEEEHEENKTT